MSSTPTGGIIDERVPMARRQLSPSLVAVVGLRCCFESQLCASDYCHGETYVVEHIVGCLGRTVSAGKSWLEDSPSGHYPVGRPCRFAGQDTDLGLDRLLERSRWVGEMAEPPVGNVLLALVVLDRVPVHQLDHLRSALAPLVACVGFLLPSYVASILCEFP